MNFKAARGFIKSWLIYYGKPFGFSRSISFYRTFITPGMLCFDIGAHLGNRTTVWLRLGASVVAAEPQPVCIQYLQKKFGNNSKVFIIPKAIAAQIDRKTIHISSLNPAVSTLSETVWMNRMHEAASFNLKWDTSIEVETTSLDHLIMQFGLPGFCKIDTEGYELNVLKGLSNPIPLLCFEVISVNKELVEPCVDKLCSLGNYEFNWSVAESLKFHLEKWTDKTGILYSINQYSKKIFSGDIYARLIQ